MQPSLHVKKRNTEFDVTTDYAIQWFDNNLNKGLWEELTFDLLDYYQNKDLIYVDVGAWIGPTVLYAQNKYKQILCFEPDPVALDILRKNIAVNNYGNIIVIDKALSGVNGASKFGGNGPLGNSESSLLVNNAEYMKTHNGDVIEVQTITIETSLKQNDIHPDKIALIKMDIEGGGIYCHIGDERVFATIYPRIIYIVAF